MADFFKDFEAVWAMIWEYIDKVLTYFYGENYKDAE